MRSLRINFILPKANLSGGVKSNRLIAEALVRRGHEVRLAFVDLPQPWPGITQPRKFLRRLGREMRMRAKQRHHLEHSSATLIPIRKPRIEATDVPEADITIATWWETAEWIRDWPESRGRKAYFVRHYEIHGGDPQRVRATYRLPYQKFVIATWLQRLMRDEFDDPNAVLIPNGVDWNQFESQPRRRPAKPTIGMLYGRERYKGAATAFEALRLVRERIHEIHFIGFGSAPLQAGDQPPDGFEYRLRPPQSEIPLLYRQCTCWLVPSTSEGFGMPGLEAAASRCPVVATRCGGPEDYVEEGRNGHLVEVGDAPTMARRLIDVLELSDAEWSRMSEASHVIARRFDWDRSAERLELALLQLVDSSMTDQTLSSEF